MVPGPIERSFRGEEDFDSLLNLLRDIAADDSSFTLIPDDYRYEWIDNEPGWDRSLTVWEHDDSLVAMSGSWFETGNSLDRAYAELEIHPAWRTNEFWDLVTMRLIAATARLVDRQVHLRLGVRKPRLDKRDALIRAEFSHDRVYHKLIAQVDAPLGVPPAMNGFVIRALKPEMELDQWIEAFNAGFASHYDPPTTTRAEKLHLMADPGYLPEADLVLVSDDGHIVGIGGGISERKDSGETSGHLSSLAILPEFRGLGLGRALLLATMAELRQAGYSRISLDVDSGNESGALALYESAGFSLLKSQDVYRRPIQAIAMGHHGCVTVRP